MKMSYFFSLLLTLMVSFVSAQTPWVTRDSKNEALLKTDALSKPDDCRMASTLIVSEISRDIEVEGHDDSPGMEGTQPNTVYSEVPAEIPFWESISLNESSYLEVPDDGVRVDAYPWYELQSNSAFTLMLPGGVDYKKATGTEIKQTAELEAILSKRNNLPVDLRVIPEYMLDPDDERPIRNVLVPEGGFPLNE